MEIRCPYIHRDHTGCFDCVPSATCARDGTPLSMTRNFVTQPDKQGNNDQAAHAFFRTFRVFRGHNSAVREACARRSGQKIRAPGKALLADRLEFGDRLEVLRPARRALERDQLFEVHAGQRDAKRHF